MSEYEISEPLEASASHAHVPAWFVEEHEVNAWLEAVEKRDSDDE